MCDVLAPFNTLQELPQLLAPLGRNDDGDRLTEHFLRGVAVHPLGAGIPTRDRAVKRLADDRIIR
jgi:hypothetical protein